MNRQDRLCVKELAIAMNVGTHFVYQMRSCGFVMERVHGRRGRRTSTLADAERWIEENNFSLVNGLGVVRK